MSAPVLRGPEIYAMRAASRDGGARRLPTNETFTQLLGRGLLRCDPPGMDGWSSWYATAAGITVLEKFDHKRAAS